MTHGESELLQATEFWKDMGHREIATFQIFEPMLCMPPEVFHEAMEKTLKRKIREDAFFLGIEALRAELLDGRPEPTVETTYEMIPLEKRKVAAPPDGELTR